MAGQGRVRWAPWQGSQNIQTLEGRTNHPHPAPPALGDTPAPRQAGSDEHRRAPTEAPGGPPVGSHPRPSKRTKTITRSHTNTPAPAPRRSRQTQSSPPATAGLIHAGIQVGLPYSWTHTRERKAGRRWAFPWPPGQGWRHKGSRPPGEGNPGHCHALGTHLPPPPPSPPWTSEGVPNCRGHLQPKSRALPRCHQPAAHYTPSVHLCVP